MALQDQNRLSMLGLGVAANIPSKFLQVLDPNNPDSALQPEIENGIHLRWASERELGFPWHGYYLLRRTHIPPCLSAKPASPSGSSEARSNSPLCPARTCVFPNIQWDNPLPKPLISLDNGQFTSDQALSTREDFF